MRSSNVCYQIWSKWKMSSALITGESRNLILNLSFLAQKGSNFYKIINLLLIIGMGKVVNEECELCTVKPLITNTSKEFIKCRILHFLIME